MTISYPLTFPPGIQPRAVTLSLDSNVSVNESVFTYRAQTQVWEGQRWLLDLSFPDLPPDTMRDWEAFLVALNGKEGTFLFGDPGRSQPRGNAIGAPVVHGAGQTGRTLITRGWGASAIGVLAPGDYLQLGNHLHMVMSQSWINADAGGVATIDIAPRLRTATVDGTPIILSSPKGIWRLTDNRVQWATDIRQAYTFSISAMEVL